MRMYRWFLLAVVVMILGSMVGSTAAHEEGDILIYDVWARPTVGRQAEPMQHGGMQHGGSAMGSGPSLPSAAYFVVENRGSHPIALVAAESPLAGRAEIHQTIVENNVARMEEAEDGVEIAAGETFAFAPGGYHVMLLELTRDLFPDEPIALTLTFEMRETDAEPMTMTVAAMVRDLPLETGGLVVSLAGLEYDEDALDEATAVLRIENRGDETSALADISHMGVPLAYTLADSEDEQGVQMATIMLGELLNMMVIPDSLALPITLSLADGKSFDFGLPFTHGHMEGDTHAHTHG